MLLTTKLHQFLDSIMSLLHKYVMELIVIMFMILFALWAVAFLANGLYGYHFDLQSCWGGFSAIGGAGVLAAIKYSMDSWKNTPEGVAPGYGSSILQKVTNTITTLTEKTTEKRTESENRGGR